MHFATLPNLVALSILVVVFWAISRKATCERVQLWLVGWVLVLLHFAADFASADGGTWSLVAATVSLDTLALATIAFLISVSAIASDRLSQICLASALGIPALAFIDAVIWGVSGKGWYYGLVVIGTLAPVLVLWRRSRHGNFDTAGLAVGSLLVAGVMTWVITIGQPELGLTVLFAALNLATAFLYWNHHRRTSAGVLTAVSGFALWGAVFPVSLLLQAVAPQAHVESEVWNIPKYLVAVGMILTLLENQIARSTYLAYHDELTELPNRRLLEDRLDQALAQADRTGNKVAVLVLDLDHFKEVNDNFGHRVGDNALQEVVTRLASRIRASDTLARSGGDEFTVVSHVADGQGAAVLVSALESSLSEPIPVHGKQVNIGLSVGLALYPDDGSDPDELRAAADRAMYIAKRAARQIEPVTASPQPSL